MTEERTWTFDQDKARWGDGPWVTEPDKVQWIDAATGLDCLAVRHDRFGHWCGYVGVAEGHPAFELHYDQAAELLPEDGGVHGGLTYSDFCAENDKEQGICHVALDGRPERIWWLGFDCCHYLDLSPGLEAMTPKNALFRELQGYQYRDLAYVKAECASLARHLAR